MDTFVDERRRMVETQIAGRGIVDEAVLDAMRTVSREVFVPGPAAEFAYEDTPLSIEEGQTISQPYVVALMAVALELTPRDRVLEVGAGSGYAAAVLSRIAAEVYYYGSAASWNLRDQHMFDTLESLRAFHGPEAKIVVWEHNSHVGDSMATEIAARGEYNVGRLCRAAHGEGAYLVGFGTDHGTVAAASDWDAPVETKNVRPAHGESYERLCHDATVPAFLLPLRDPAREEVREELLAPRLERAIGVIYRPESELASHYFQAVLPEQFDEYVWFDRTDAVTALGRVQTAGMPETYPFGL